MLKHYLAGAVVALSAVTLAAGAAETGTPPNPGAGLGATLTHAYIAPAMQNFQQAATSTGQALQEACGADQAGPSDQVADAFQNLVAAWSGIEFLRFGPLVENNRFERIYFWPDTRGITTRQAQKLLAQDVGDIPDANALKTHSVALQGLPALEYVLYRDNGLLSGAQAANQATACAYAIAIAGNLAALGSELVTAWTPQGDYASLFSNPSADNPLYRTPQEVASEVVKALSTGLQFQTDVKLGPALGTDADHAQARKAPFWRSGLTAHSIEHATQGMLAFYKAGGYAFDEAEWIDQNIQGELHRAIAQLSSVSGVPDELFTQPETHQQLVLAKLLLANTKNLIDQDMAPALGVAIGFNALDGD